ncbi:MAG: hypothetical protein HY718_08040 [Planctomycetes bacterium]|nr:hypothetical protein [Planctomycetota bacterium]
MSEYARIGEGWVFWQKYGNQLHAVDASLVAPVLQSLAASTGPKWLSDINAYRCRIDGKEFEIVFDMQDDESGMADVIVFRTEGDDKNELGTISVQLPCEDWAALQEQLKELLE